MKTEIKNGWFIEQIKGEGIVVNETTLWKILNNQPQEELPLDLFKVKFDTMKMVLNHLMKTYVGDAWRMLNVSTTNTIVKKYDPEKVEGWTIRVNLSRWNNNRTQTQMYVDINGRRSIFLRFAVMEDKILWILNYTELSKVLNIPIIESNTYTSELVQGFVEAFQSKTNTTTLVEEQKCPTEAMVEDLKKCPKVGDAGRFTDDPKAKKVRKTSKSSKLEYIIYKGGLEIKRGKTLKGLIGKADSVDGDIYYTGDLPEGVVCEGISSFLNNKVLPVYTAIPF